jgi:hypothetical protein
MNNDKIALIESNIRLLEKGISLQEYAEKAEMIKIDGKTDVYNKYGFFVIYNRTKNVYLLDGGNSPAGFTMSVTIPQFFLTDAGRGNPYMHQHYQDGDDMILKFHCYNPEEYASMDEFREALVTEYNKTGITYFDYLMKNKGQVNNMNQQGQSRNQYYNGGSNNTEKKILAAKLLRLEHKSKFWYEVLNFIVGVLVKPIPLFVILLLNSRDLFWGENLIQKGMMFIGGVLGSYFASIMFYLMFLAAVQIFKLFFCKYKKLTIRIRIFDIIIKHGAKKFYSNEDIELYREHENNTIGRKNKINSGKKRATEHYYQKKEEELKYRQQELEREERDYEYNSYNAERKLKKAKENEKYGISGEKARKEGKEYADKAAWDAQNIERIKREKEELERKLGKRK